MTNFPFEILIPRRPLSHQANRQNLQKWRDFIYGRARQKWQGIPSQEVNLRFSIVYFCNDFPADMDNIIKPIQDSLAGVVFADDSQISDVDSHRRFLSDKIDITNLPNLLVEGVIANQECVYIRVTLAEKLEIYL